jgi:TnpA family transposase
MDGCEHVLFSEIIILTLILSAVSPLCVDGSFISFKVDTNMRCKWHSQYGLTGSMFVLSIGAVQRDTLFAI